MRAGRHDSGFTFMSVLIFLALAGALFWLFAYGQAYYENLEVKHIVSQAANLAYSHPGDDGWVKDFIVREMHRAFDEDVLDHGRMQRELRVDFDPEDVRIDRTDQPPLINIWVTYSRMVTLPLVGERRQVTFTEHAEQDLSPVKW